MAAESPRWWDGELAGAAWIVGGAANVMMQKKSGISGEWGRRVPAVDFPRAAGTGSGFWPAVRLLWSPPSGWTGSETVWTENCAQIFLIFPGGDHALKKG